MLESMPESFVILVAVLLSCFASGALSYMCGYEAGVKEGAAKASEAIRKNFRLVERIHNEP